MNIILQQPAKVKEMSKEIERNNNSVVVNDGWIIYPILIQLITAYII